MTWHHVAFRLLYLGQPGRALGGGPGFYPIIVCVIPLTSETIRVCAASSSAAVLCSTFLSKSARTPKIRRRQIASTIRSSSTSTRSSGVVSGTNCLSGISPEQTKLKHTTPSRTMTERLSAATLWLKSQSVAWTTLSSITLFVGLLIRLPSPSAARSSACGGYFHAPRIPKSDRRASQQDRHYGPCRQVSIPTKFFPNSLLCLLFPMAPCYHYTTRAFVSGFSLPRPSSSPGCRSGLRSVPPSPDRPIPEHRAPRRSR